MVQHYEVEICVLPSNEDWLRIQVFWNIRLYGIYGK
jgi:hypothetical protein